MCSHLLLVKETMARVLPKGHCSYIHNSKKATVTATWLHVYNERKIYRTMTSPFNLSYERKFDSIGHTCISTSIMCSSILSCLVQRRPAICDLASFGKKLYRLPENEQLKRIHLAGWESSWFNPVWHPKGQGDEEIAFSTPAVQHWQFHLWAIQCGVYYVMILRDVVISRDVTERFIVSKTSCRQVAKMNSKKPKRIVRRFDSRRSRLLLSVGICRAVCWFLRSSPSAWKFLPRAESWRILFPVNRSPPNSKREQQRNRCHRLFCGLEILSGRQYFLKYSIAPI